jgi:dihydrodipicolinate reductase
MKIMVCGPIGGVGIGKILEMREFLESSGFETVKQFSKGKDYSKIQDFRKKTTLVKKIIKHDLDCIKKADVLVVLPEPSFGASIEMFVAKNAKKKVILFSSKPVPSPWPVAFSDVVVTSKNELVRKLNKMM